MTNKNTKRKFNLVTKVNLDEYQNIINSFDSSGYSTVGHFIRDAILDNCNSDKHPTLSIPKINQNTADDLAAALNDLNELMNQFDALPLEKKDRYQEKYFGLSSNYLKKIVEASVTWTELFKGNVESKKVVMNLAALILSSSDLNKLLKFVKSREEEQSE